MRCLALLPLLLAVGALLTSGALSRAMLGGVVLAGLAQLGAWMADRRTRTLTVGSESRAAIMFVDVRDFTLLTGRMQPRDVFRVVNRLLDDIIPIIEKHGGRVEKFLGDGVMASFGLERPLDNPALSAVRAALKVQESCAWLNCRDEFRKAVRCVEPLRVELGVGIAKGRVFSGSVGTGKLHEFTALGRTVNLASRLCDLASRGEVRCCNFTYLDIRDYARFQRSEEVQMKGLDKTIRTYSIQGVSDHAITRPVKPGTRPLSALDQINAEDFATRVIRRLPEDVRRTRIMTATPAEFEVDS
jgi:adenylate cyclase